MLKSARHAGAPLLLRRTPIIMPVLTLVMFIAVVPAKVRGQQASKLELKTTSFEPGGFIPKRFTASARMCRPRSRGAIRPPARRDSLSSRTIPTLRQVPLCIGWFMTCRQLPAGFRKRCQEMISWRAGVNKERTTSHESATVVAALHPAPPTATSFGFTPLTRQPVCPPPPRAKS